MEEAARHWRNLVAAEANCARLRTYRNMTKDMRADYHRHSAIVHDSRAALARLLGGH